MYTFSNSFLADALKNAEWGTFIEPDHELENYHNPDEKYKLCRGSNYKPDFSPYITQSPAFHALITKIDKMKQAFSLEDQCSAKYYFDIYTLTQNLLGKINRIVDVGVFMGGSANILAACIENKNIQLDLVDFGSEYLRITYERIRRSLPEVAKRTRLFLGDLPTYTKNVLLKEESISLIHHDASHNFNEVVRDLAALSFVKNKINGLIIQDTHLRGGNIATTFFVDAALYAVFGGNMPFYELGIKLNAPTQPTANTSFGVYFIDNQPEGMYIPFELVKFRYPHESVPLDSILPKAEFSA